MKNIPELSCAIVEDLLPTYVERLTSEETNMAVEAHLASCPACAAKRTAMGAKETEAAGQNAEETAREVDYLKKVRRRNRRRVWLAVACTTLVLAAVILTKIFIIGGPGQANDVGVRLVEIVDGDTLSVNVDCLYAVNAFCGGSTATRRWRRCGRIPTSSPARRAGWSSPSPTGSPWAWGWLRTATSGSRRR